MKDRASQDEALTTELGKHPFPNGNPLNKLQEKKTKHFFKDIGSTISNSRTGKTKVTCSIKFF